MEPNTEVIYKVSGYYSAEHDHGLAWDDAVLGIEWPVAPEAVVLSDKDRHHPRLADLPQYFD
jgi:dTDP-4-dehydrorhamnose 3,5-epimerase